MPRPKKWRKVCRLPKNSQFGPTNFSVNSDSYIKMTVDEYETIRLIDLEGFTQEECANQMNVARTTIQAIYNRARKKLADSLVNGKMLKIEGGEYKLCEDNFNQNCSYGKGCYRHRHGRKFIKIENEEE